MKRLITRHRVLFVVLMFVPAACVGSCGGASKHDADASTDTGGDDTSTDTVDDGGVDGGDDGGVPMNPSDYSDATPPTWVPIDGGTFLQGSISSLSPASYSETPAHDVTVTAFELTKTEVTVAQYAQCVVAEVCATPLTTWEGNPVENNNWLVWGLENHPVNYVNALEAETYCAWAGGRLPSESEWEYAARSLGADNEHPWGDAEAGCDYAVMRSNEDGGNGCGTGRTWPVCSKAPGNTEQGLCDMAGNVEEWVADCFYADYMGAPTDGSAWIVGTCEDNVSRGASYRSISKGLRTRTRGYNPSWGHGDYRGFRCARAVP